jgi:phage terminase small subunit
VARKKIEGTEKLNGLAEDKQSPDKPARRVITPPKTAVEKPVVKVAGGRVVKPVPAKDQKKPVKKAKKPAATTRATSAKAKPKQPLVTGGAAGKVKVGKAVALNKKEVEALQAGNLHGLDERQAKFIDLWLVTQNGTQAYQDAGFECKSDAVAAAGASRLLRKVKEHPYTLAKRAELFAKTEEITNRVIERVYGAAMADPRELAEVVYRCCRYCHGDGHRYQMTPRQMEERQERHKQAVAEAKEAKRRPPVYDPLGGLGFDMTLDPHPECPECNGVGVRNEIINDTRYLSPGALSLYGGWKTTKDGGAEVKIADQRPYLELLGRIFNMNIEPAPPVVLPVSNEQLQDIYARGLEKTNLQRQAMADRAAQIADLDNGGDA